MGYKKLVIIGLCLVIFTGVMFFEVSVEKEVLVPATPQRAISNEDEQLLQIQVQEIIKNGKIADCAALNNSSYRLGCEQFFASEQKTATSGVQTSLKVVETKILTAEEAKEIIKTLPSRNK